MVKMSIVRSCVFVSVLGISCAGAKTPTLYDVLQLIYQVCSTTGEERERNLMCVSSFLSKEVQITMEGCVGPNATLDDFCDRMTLVPGWAAKHSLPPPHITRVLGLSALGRMACVLSELQRPLPMWQAAFAKCFPHYQSAASLLKDSTGKRSGNALDGK